MVMIHGNTRDFKEEVCDDLAGMILGDFNVAHKTLAPEDKEEWSPNMDEAPKDGSLFLSCNSRTGQVLVTLWCKYDHVPLYGFHHYYRDEDCEGIHPTHWKRITLPKQEQSKPNKEK